MQRSICIRGIIWYSPVSNYKVSGNERTLVRSQRPPVEKPPLGSHPSYKGDTTINACIQSAVEKGCDI